MLLLEDKVSKVIEILKKEITENFGCDSDDCYCVHQDEIDMALFEVGIEAEVYFGVSKLVIVLPDCSQVIKVPFNGNWYYGERYNEETDEWEAEEEVFTHFEYANDLNCEDARDWDYCENELIKYENAVEEGYADLFPVTTFYGYIQTKCAGDYPIYLQDKCTIFDDVKKEKEHTPSENAKSIYNSNKDKYRACVNNNWIMELIDAYGEEKAEAMLNYIHREYLDEDLHNGNIGYNSCGFPVLVDWAGWRD